MKFPLSDELLQALRKLRYQQRQKREERNASGAMHGMREMDRLQEEVEHEHDAFMLHPGIGPMTYITADGNVLLDSRTWDGEKLSEANDDQAIGALVIGAQYTGIAALLELIPRQPDDGSVCPLCCGSRWLDLPRSPELVPNSRNEIVCIVCGGRGWVVQAMLDEAESRGYWPLRTT
jgi:hypothetical protein